MILFIMAFMQTQTFQYFTVKPMQLWKANFSKYDNNLLYYKNNNVYLLILMTPLMTKNYPYYY